MTVNSMHKQFNHRRNVKIAFFIYTEVVKRLFVRALTVLKATLAIRRLLTLKSCRYTHSTLVTESLALRWFTDHQQQVNSRISGSDKDYPMSHNGMVGSQVQ